MKVFEGSFLAVWARLLQEASVPGKDEIPGYVAVITSLDIGEGGQALGLVNAALKSAEAREVQTVANTIFPASLWDPGRPRAEFYSRYESLWKKIKQHPANYHGVYFRRITHFETGSGPINQAEMIIGNYLSGNHRRSAMQICIYDPARDLTNARRRGFPCMQHLVITPLKDRWLELTAFYATQTVFEKSAGNFLGLWRLAEFFARALEMRVARIQCVSSVGLRGKIPSSEARVLAEGVARVLEAKHGHG